MSTLVGLSLVATIFVFLGIAILFDERFQQAQPTALPWLMEVRK